MREAEFTPEDGVEVRRTRTLEMWIGKDGIIRFVCTNATQLIEDARQNIALIPRDKPRPILADIRKLGGVKREARHEYRETDARHSVTAIAIVVESPLSRTIGNFFVGLSRFYLPTRLFTSAPEAAAWLRHYRYETQSR
jgi:hypothetical protein